MADLYVPTTEQIKAAATRMPGWVPDAFDLWLAHHDSEVAKPKCAVCLWMDPDDPERQLPAVTVCNGTAVCQGHLHLTTSDPTVAAARRFKLENLDPYQPEEF